MHIASCHEEYSLRMPGHEYEFHQFIIACEFDSDYISKLIASMDAKNCEHYKQFYQK